MKTIAAITITKSPSWARSVTPRGESWVRRLIAANAIEQPKKSASDQETVEFTADEFRGAGRSYVA